MSQEKFWVLLSKKLAGEASGNELLDLEALILEHPEWQYAIQNLGDLWNHQPTKDTMQEEDAYMLHLHRMTEKNVPFGEGPVEEHPAKKPTIRKWYWTAAAAAVLVAGGIFIYTTTGNTTPGNELAVKEINEVSTRQGSKSKVQLPDGTVVLLNAGSKLTYNKDFGKGVREVHLTGEGFFDVKKMKETPFIIHTASINIKVLGTVFNVKAYPEDKKTETSLIRGSIEVTIKDRPNDKIILSPSEKLVVENSILLRQEDVKIKENAVEINGADISTLVSINKLKYNPTDSSVVETQWIDNKLVFRDESFDELARRLERWYDVNIDIKDNRLRSRRFSGIFTNETIEQALEALKISVPFEHEQLGNKIIIHR
ncbi:MAG TPA: FecR family protein [Chitinophagaceae bacterium]